MVIRRTAFSGYELTAEDAMNFRDEIKSINNNKKIAMSVKTDVSFVVESLTSHHDVSQFSCDDVMIFEERYLKKEALSSQEENLAKTFVLINPEYSSTRVWGYITLVMSEIIVNEDEFSTQLLGVPAYEFYPSVRVVKFAVDKDIDREGLGRMLLASSIHHVQSNIMPHIGCRYMVLDSPSELIEFYEKNGFHLFESGTHEPSDYSMMFLDLKS